jgi:hypothetical protein
VPGQPESAGKRSQRVGVVIDYQEIGQSSMYKIAGFVGAPVFSAATERAFQRLLW